MKDTIKNLLILPLALFILSGCEEIEDIDDMESKIKDPDISEKSVCTGKVSGVSSRLNVRTSPEITDNVCTKLEADSPVIISLDGEENGFLKILTSECGEEQSWVYVSKNYIDLNDDCFEGDRTPDGGDIEEEEKPIKDPIVEPPKITDLGSYITKNLFRVKTTRPLTRNSSKGSVEVFKAPGSGTNSICGTKHIRSNRSHPYMGKDTMCAFTAIAQEWAQKECPKGNKNCRIMLGDASFGAKQPSSWPHSTHRRGWCMDIWPMRKKNCGEKEVRWQDSCYDRTATKKFVKLLIKHGADKGNQFFFNDPQISETRRLRNHDDHIHVCFKPSNSTVKTRCERTTVDRKICSEFK